ncbi:MAG TPA: SdrD B-like domain-containing protein [Solirubrobacteraceae bacterium]|nr:SdrD B-like domain-containing protein [Solirubrobacteraceae bacterium]
MRPILAAVAVLLLLAPPAEAAPDGVARGSVWLDADADGRREAGESGLAGVTVTLQRKRNGTWRAVARPRTSAAGTWRRRQLKPGRYRIALALPAQGSAFSARGPDSDVRANGRSPKVRLRPGRRIRFDAGVVPRLEAGPPTPPAPPAPEPPAPAVLAGVAWDDVDRDGARDPGEPGRAGVAVELWDAARTAAVTATTSDLDGRFSLAAPAPGEYRLRHVLAPGTFYAPNGAGSAIHDDGGNAGFSESLALGPGTTAAAVGVITPAAITIGDLVWRDGDADGNQVGDSTLGHSAEVELWNDSLTQRLAVTVITGTDGHYSLPAVSGGAYRVRVVLWSPDLYGFSPRDAATDATDSDVPRLGPLAGITDTLRPVTTTTSVDAGIVNRTAIGNFVWNDADGDGRQDGVEKGVTGVTVELWDTTKTTRFETTTTDTLGRYTLRTPYPGTYRVHVLLPGRASAFTTQNAGVDDDIDSDVDADGWTGPIAATTFLVGIGNQDAGVRFP